MRLDWNPAAYDFKAPAQLIATAPASPRDAARLLAYEPVSGRVDIETFRQLTSHLERGTVLVLNETKVIPARLVLTKPTGGLARVLYLRTVGREIEVLSDRKLAIGERLQLAAGKSFLVTGQSGSTFTLRPSFSLGQLQPVMDRLGQTPLPPYLRHTALTEAERRRGYQTIFARVRGSVAAPTASLHFSPRLLAALRRAGVELRLVTLHVGLGTFAPLTTPQLRSGELHAEQYQVPASTAAAINRARREGWPVVAVGTTVCRALESAADGRGRVRAGRGETRLFIRPGYRFKVVDGLITNFHVPRSSLMMLVAALIGRAELLRLYQLAVRKGLRLFSFGDGMLVKPRR